MPPEERIATFDQDGSLWVEHPIYSQFIYCLDRVPAVVKAKPALAEVEPFKTVLSGDREAIARLPLRGLVLSYLRANGYKTYIVTGGGRDFVRQYSERIYGIPPEQMVGSAGETKFNYGKTASRSRPNSAKSSLTTTTRVRRRTYV